jgi:hypothetical protein
VNVLDTIYATEMLRLRIPKKYFPLPSGWMGGGRIHTFYKQKYFCQKLWITFHHLHLRGGMDALIFSSPQSQTSNTTMRWLRRCQKPSGLYSSGRGRRETRYTLIEKIRPVRRLKSIASDDEVACAVLCVNFRVCCWRF